VKQLPQPLAIEDAAAQHVRVYHELINEKAAAHG